MNWSGKRVLVTGAGGFIGSHLTERLVEEGATVRGMVHYNAQGSRGWLDDSKHRNEIEILAGDICDRDSVNHAVKGVNVVFHLAALIGIPYSYDAPGSYVRTNVEGTLNVLRCGLETGVERVVHTSTSEVYGTARREPIDEEHPLQGQSPYSASKIGADKLAESFHLSFELPLVTVRPFNTFGPRQSARAVIPTIITQCLTRKDIRLGNLDPTRDLNYVGNTVDGFLRAGSVDAAIGKTINIGSGQKISIGDLAKLIASMTGRTITIEHDDKRSRPIKSEVGCLLADNTLARKLLGWEPRVGLKEGLKFTIEWIGKNLERYRPNEFSV
jgi:NAD dependent epimerase/dehydratase